MEQEVDQIAQAILVASDPTQGSLQSQALQFIQTSMKIASEPWRLGLMLFLNANADGSRKYEPIVRFHGLRILEEYLETRYEPLDAEAFHTLQQAFVSYIQAEYVNGSAEGSASYIRNKFSHTLTLLFLCTYLDLWPSFFADFFSLIRSQNAQSTSQASAFNPHVSLLLFHLVLEISGEVADQMLKSARAFNATRHARDAKVRDAMRERDAAGINEAVLTIVADGAEKMAQARKTGSGQDMDRLSEVVDWGVRTFGSYVGWIDINLTVTPTTVPLLFSLLSDPSLPIRLATSVALLRMVSKGLKEPSDKLQLFRVLSLGQVLEALEARTRQEQLSRGEDTDEGEESYREALGRLLNGYGLELAKLTEDSNVREDVKFEASSMLSDLRPTMLRFLADPYDDTTSTIFPLLSNILGTLKKIKRSTPDEITNDTRSFLSSTLNALLQKMKWDEDADLDDIDDDDRHAFESLRKGDLRVHLDSILVIDQDLAINAVQALVMNTLAAYETGSSLKWSDAELAIYLVYLFGEINKSGGKGRAAFCLAPAVAKEARKGTDYSEYPLTTHGEMLMALVRSGICSYPHNAVAMQFFETCARYGDFFKVRKECIVPLLEALVGPRGVHHRDVSVRSRVFYLFYKFIKEDRNEIPLELVVTLLNGIRDVLTIEVTLPELERPAEQDLLTEAIKNSSTFDSQLYLFEVAGILISLTFKSPSETAALLLSVVQPLLDDLQINLQAVKSADDVVPILKVHHVVMALGNIAKGFPDMPSPITAGYIMPPIGVFRQMTQAIVVSLEAMNVFKVVRDATRFAFSRMVATTGSQVTDFIPPLMSNLLAHFEPTELVDFMGFIGLLMHRLQHEMFDVLDQLIVPLHRRITEMLASPVTGTDDKNAHTDTKRAYLTFLSSILSNNLHGVFLTDANKPQFGSLLESAIAIAADVSDPVSQRLSFAFLGRCVNVWGQPSPAVSTANGNGPTAGQGDAIPGFESFMYERLVPLAFQIPSAPNLNIKDGQVLVVLHEVANLLQSISKARGQECYEFLVTVFLPSQNCPPETASDFVTKLRDLDIKGFRKYFTEFVRASRQSSS